ncbi:hypothetical protein Pint_27493 [Pistacia integerrima]|uniref:Uncharacterized protein n=1 Tax=Pistacia integerrima TaxID=434235 RepID=A0ACC0YUJ7_9ROSI|nr:hypothetical protein Pint_27493 [Pistacia integerrima]
MKHLFSLLITMKHFMQPRNTILRETHSNLNSLLPPTLAPSKMKSPLAPRPSNPLKRKLATDMLPENVMVGVPNSEEEEEGEMVVHKFGNEAFKINGQTFTFDSVADIDSTQLAGLPLIENCLAGFTSSVFVYGQGVERLIPCGGQLMPCWKKTYQVINEA